MSSGENDGYKSRVPISLATARDLAEQESAELHQSGPISRESAASAAQINTNTVKIMNRLRNMDMLVPGSQLGAEIKNEYRRIP